MIHPNLRKLIGSSSGDLFEEFCKSFCQHLYGSVFRPFGGKKDGGRDGLLYVQPGKERKVFQFSVDEKPKKKIAKTFERLSEFLAADYAKVSGLVYMTNQIVKDAEELEESFQSEHGKQLRIRDLNWIMANLDSSNGTLQAANDHYLEERQSLSEIEIQPEVYLFFSLIAGDGDGMIDHTLDIRSRAIDALILQELIGTSSENTMPRPELITRLTNKHPWIRAKHVDTALKRLNERHSKKTNVRLINWHKKPDVLCLPYDTVCEMQLRKNESVAFCDFVANKLKEYIQEVAKPKEAERVWSIVQEYLAKVFQTRGSSLLDWTDSESKAYQLAPSDLELLQQTLLERGMRGPLLTKTYQYAINRLLGCGDSRVALFLSRLNEAFLLHLISGRDIKVHSTLERMRGSLTLVCCSSVLIPQFLDALRFDEPLLKKASRAGIRLLVTEGYLNEVRAHLQESLRSDTEEGGAPTEVSLFAASTHRKVREVLESVGLQTPHLGNLSVVLRTLLKVEPAPPLYGNSEIERLARALLPHRENSMAKAMADACVFYYIKALQEKAAGHYTTWWLTRESMTVKTAQALNIPADRYVYMRLSFLQDMLLLLPAREEIEEKVNLSSWAQDTLLLVTPNDIVPNELLTPYRKAKKQYDSGRADINRLQTITRMNAFMAIGKGEDRSSPG